MDDRDLRVFRENLRLLGKRRRAAERISDCQLHEAVTLYGEALREKGAALTPEEGAEAAAWLYREITGEDSLITPAFARFCMAFQRQFSNIVTVGAMLRRSEGELSVDLPQLTESGRTSYLRNVYTDRAYRVFSALHGKMTAAYSTGYVPACEEVYYGRSAYVILPLYSSTDGRPITFHRMLAKYELTIASACLVEPEDGEAVVYGLAKRGRPNAEGEVLDVSVALPDGVGAASYFSACEAFGFRLIFVNTTPREYAVEAFGAYEINLHLDAREAACGAFALFSEASRIPYRVDGMYRIHRG